MTYQLPKNWGAGLATEPGYPEHTTEVRTLTLPPLNGKS